MEKQTIALLQATIDDIHDEYPSALIYIKGDANASCPPRANNKRDLLFQTFLDDNWLRNLNWSAHKTYHHFIGEGKSDSNTDVARSSITLQNGLLLLHQKLF